MSTLTIGQLAKQTGLSRVAIRYYERIGLLLGVGRGRSGYRLYSAETVALLQFIKNAKEVGFSLDEIKDLIHMQHQPKASRKTIKTKVAAKHADIHLKIESLQKIAKALQQLTSACDGEGPLDTCPILIQLYSESAELHNHAVNNEFKKR